MIFVKIYVSLTRRILAAVFGLCLVILLLSGSVASAVLVDKNADTNKQRADFAQSIRCEIDEDTASKKEITIPIEFDKTYQNYNELQKRAGFDLLPYRGCEAKVYTYKVLSYGPFKAKDNAVLNLIVYNGRIIGGDISTVSTDGVMLPLLRGENIGETAP